MYRTMRGIAIAAMALAMFGAATNVRAADTSLDELLVQDQAVNNGLGYSESPIGGDLAWGDSYFMEAYQNAYDATGDTKWLDKIVEHADRIIAGAQDINGDGYEGWSDGGTAHWLLKNTDFAAAGGASSSPELIVNGGFETDADANGIPDGWTPGVNSAKSQRSTAAPDVFAGSAGATVELDGTNANWLVQTITGLAGGKTYAVSAYSGVETEQANGLIQVYNATTSQVLAFARVHHLNYEQFPFQFTAPSSGTIQLRLGLEGTDVAGLKARFDNVSVKLADAPGPELVNNRGMEIVDPGDATLPQSWTRFPVSTSANVYLASGINNWHSGTYGLRVKSSGSAFQGIYQHLTYTPNQKYVVTFNGRVSDPNYRGRVQLLNATTNTPIVTKEFADTRWTRYAFEFAAPATAGQDLQLVVYHNSAPNGFEVTVDTFSIRSIVQTEAGGWTRSATTPLGNAHRTNDPDAYPNGDWGMELVHDGTNDPLIGQRILNYEPSVPHAFEIRTALSPGATGGMRIRDVTAGAVIAAKTFNTSGSQLLDFTTPADPTHELQAEVYMTSGTAGQTMQVYYAKQVLAPITEHFHYDGRIGAPIVEFVRTVYQDARLHAKYKAIADGYLAFAADNLFRKWDNIWVQLTGTDGQDNGTGIYLLPSGNDTEWFPTRSEVHNHYNVYVTLLYNLYAATEGIPAYAAERPYYLSRANDLMRTFKSHLRTNTIDSGAYEWNYWDNLGSWDDGLYVNYAQYSDDLSHAAANLPAVLAAYREGFVMGGSDIDKFARTFTNVLWNGSLTQPVLSWYLNRTPYHRDDVLRTYLFHHWVDLSPFNREVWDIANAICRTDICTVYPASGVFKGSPNKTSNPGFELASTTDATLPAGWDRWLSTASTAFVSGTSPYAGKHVAVLRTDGAAVQGLEQKLTGYEPQTAYTVAFSGITDGTVSGTVEAYDVTAGSTLSSRTFANTAWADDTFAFVTPPAGHDVRIRLHPASSAPAGAEVQFDEVRALPALADSDLPNGGFETADLYDAALPRYWKRNGGNTTAEVKLDAADKSAGTSALHVTSSASAAIKFLYYEWKGYVPNASYTMSFAGKVAGAGTTGRVRVTDLTAGVDLTSRTFTNTSWAAQSVTFTAPSAPDHVLRIMATVDNSTTAGHEAWFDEMGVVLN
ncbi:hypothetical protein [Paenibacillus cymbidii]|uniref:hypothetical protein n=1 Tax=Paenibacillus cymbidii TaxID=1639034 RepID=UPI0010803117|nr:hypothetical protein [Paenibacillus cymbidii]